MYKLRTLLVDVNYNIHIRHSHALCTIMHRVTLNNAADYRTNGLYL